MTDLQISTAEYVNVISGKENQINAEILLSNSCKTSDIQSNGNGNNEIPYKDSIYRATSVPESRQSYHQSAFSTCRSTEPRNTGNILGASNFPPTAENSTSCFNTSDQPPASPLFVSCASGVNSWNPGHSRQGSHIVFNIEHFKQDSTCTDKSPHVKAILVDDKSPVAADLVSESRCRSSSLSRVEQQRSPSSDPCPPVVRNRATTLGASSLSAYDRHSRLLQVRQQKPIRRRPAQVISPLARTPCTSPQTGSIERLHELSNEVISNSSNAACSLSVQADAFRIRTSKSISPHEEPKYNSEKENCVGQYCQKQMLPLIHPKKIGSERTDVSSTAASIVDTSMLLPLNDLKELDHNKNTPLSITPCSTPTNFNKTTNSFTFPVQSDEKPSADFFTPSSNGSLHIENQIGSSSVDIDFGNTSNNSSPKNLDEKIKKGQEVSSQVTINDGGSPGTMTPVLRRQTLVRSKATQNSEPVLPSSFSPLVEPCVKTEITDKPIRRPNNTSDQMADLTFSSTPLNAVKGLSGQQDDQITKSSDIEKTAQGKDKARSQGFEVSAANNFALPFRDASFDAVISIGVIHHFASREKRLKALDELSRILAPGGKLMVYVWAFEQTHRKFDSQDVLIPWVRPEGLPRWNTAGTTGTDQATPISVSQRYTRSKDPKRAIQGNRIHRLYEGGPDLLETTQIRHFCLMTRVKFYIRQLIEIKDFLVCLINVSQPHLYQGTTAFDHHSSCAGEGKSSEQGFQDGGNKKSNSNSNPSDDASPDLEMKYLEKPKTYLRVITPVLISSSADESDGMSPGNLSPCSWYTGSGVTSGESDGAGAMQKEQALKFIALDKVCFGQGQSDGQMHLQNWVESQQSWNFDSHSSHEDLSANAPKYSGRNCRTKQFNSGMRKGVLPHIQVHALRDLDVKTCKSDPNLPDVPQFVVSAEPDQARVRALSDVSAMNNQRTCRYSDSVFSDTLRTPSIATPCLRTPSSGGGPSDYNTSTEVLFAPSDLADNNEGCFDNDSVFTPDYERDALVKNILIKDPQLKKAEVNTCTDTNTKKIPEDIDAKNVNSLMKRQRKRRNSIPIRDARRISSSDSESQKSIAFTQKIGNNSNDKMKPTSHKQSHQYLKNNDSNPLKSMFDKIAGIFSNHHDIDVDKLLPDIEDEQSQPCAELSLDIEVPLSKNESSRSSDEEEDLEEINSSDLTTASSSLTQCSDAEESWNDFNSDNPTSEGNSNINEIKLSSEGKVQDSLENNHKCSSCGRSQKKREARTLPDASLQNDTSKEACTSTKSLKVENVDTKERVRRNQQKKKLNNTIIQFLAEKWSKLFSNGQSDENLSEKDEGSLNKSLPSFGAYGKSSCINQKAGSGKITNLTGAQRPKTLDFSSKRPRMRGKKKYPMEKYSVILDGGKQSSRKTRKSQKQQLGRRLSLVAALNLLSEGACEESFVEKLDESAAEIFREMRKLNFTVREFPRSSLENTDAGKHTHEKCLTNKAADLEQYIHTTKSSKELPNLNTNNIDLAGRCGSGDITGGVQPTQNIVHKVKSYGLRRRYSDSSAAQRSRRAYGMVHLKPPNWTLDIQHHLTTKQKAPRE
ncbi:hypothetical protein EGW08_008641 [Elysia chlorotica]|uniref:Methyltransferase type 11 domain-containing protein n=1 Tax=Elysia chlorotica TaxID=188477 RepID=A0A3S1C5K9_ELYCH|nr:hypothetical protein EGW08_008641 [Elysia chlorotica]